MADPASTKFGFQAVLEHAARIASLGGITVVVLSVSYDFSFLRALGISFSDVPTTIADHVRSAIVWAPIAAAIAFLTFLLMVALARLGWILQPPYEVRDGQRKLRAGWYTEMIALLCGSTAIVAVATYSVLFSDSLIGFYALAVFAFAAVMWWAIGDPAFGRRLSTEVLALLMFVPAIVIGVGALGYADAEAVLDRKSPRWEVVVEQEGKKQVLQINGLRRFESAAVIVKSTKEIFVVGSDAIGSARRITSPESPGPNICRWFGVWCSKRER